MNKGKSLLVAITLAAITTQLSANPNDKLGSNHGNESGNEPGNESGSHSSGMSLSFESWSLLNHGEKILKFSAINKLINNWDEYPNAVIEIRYPGGEEGELWVEELKNWLVSLAIPSDRIVLLPGSDAKDVINLSVINREKKHE